MFKGKWFPLFVVVVILAMVVSLVGCSSAPKETTGEKTAPAETPKKVEYPAITILGGPQGGGFYATMVQMLDHLPKDIDGLTVSGTEGASAENVALVNKGRDAQVGVGWASECGDGWGARNYFIEMGPQDNVQVMLNFMQGEMYLIATKASGIKTLADVKDKKFGPGNPGSGAEKVSRTLLNNLDITYDSIKAAGGQVIHEGFGQYGALMRDGLLDAFIIPSTAGVAFGPVLEAQTYVDLSILPLEGDYVDKFLAENEGFGEGVLKANTYKDQTEEVNVINYYCWWFVNKDLPEELVYEITKSCYNNLESWYTNVPNTKDMADKNMLLFGIPRSKMHPGALRFWEEIKYPGLQYLK